MCVSNINVTYTKLNITKVYFCIEEQITCKRDYFKNII